jgi:hypothetical protein
VFVVGAVATNDGSVPVRVTGLHVSDRNTLITDRVAGPLHSLPVLLAPGESRNLSFALLTSCSPGRRAGPTPPVVTVTVRDGNGHRWDVAARIPELDVLWTQTQTSQACGPAPTTDG